MDTDEQSEQTPVSMIDTVIVVPAVEEVPTAPDYGATIAALELRIAALEAARVEVLNNDGPDDDRADREPQEERPSEEEPERECPVTRHWLFGELKLW